jgi:hypothetical protein
VDPSLFEALAHACLVLRSDEELQRDLPGYLQAHGVPEQDIAALMTNGTPRFSTYRMLVRNNLEGVCFRMLPRTRARMGPLFDATFADFLAEAAPRTHYLRDVPSEFLDWALPTWRSRASNEVPRYLLDLARHELVDFAVAAVPGRTCPIVPGELALDRPVAFAETVRLVRYAFAVHELPAAADDRTQPTERDVHLLVYRDVEHTVRYLELTPLAALMLDHMVRAGEPLGAALTATCAEMGIALNDEVLASTARLLADFANRCILLGSAP